MKILLISPNPVGKGIKYEECCTGPNPKPIVPSQLLLCTGYLRERGLNVEFVDQQVRDSEIHYQDYDVVVGWANIGLNLLNDMTSLAKAHDVGTKTILVLQGAPQLEKGAMEKFTYVDAAIRMPEREATLERLLVAWDTGTSIDFPGVVYRSDVEIIDTGTAAYMESWEHLGGVAHLIASLDLSCYSHGLVLSGRGCPHSCTYCSLAQTPQEHRKVEAVIGDMTALHKGGLQVVLLDSDTLADMDWTSRFCDKVADSGISWRALTRADRVTTEKIEMLKRAGCTCIMMGAETADEDILKKIRKGCTLERVLDAARICHSADVGCHFSFMVGFPWDTRGTIAKNLALMSVLGPATFSVQTLFPLRGTMIYEEMRELGFFEEVSFDEYCHNKSVYPMFPGLYLSRDEIALARNKLQACKWRGI